MKIACMTAGIDGPVRRAGREAVQFYAAWPEATVERCVKELKGFDKVSLAPGETKVASTVVTARDLAYWDDFMHRFRTEAGPVEILTGASSADIRGRVRIAVGPRVFAD